MADRRGKNVKTRPAVILTASDEIGPNQPFVAVAISRTPDSDADVELPWQHDGHPKTGLSERSYAIGKWLVAIRQNQIQVARGHVPPAVLKQIVEAIPKPQPNDEKKGDEREEAE